MVQQFCCFCMNEEEKREYGSGIGTQQHPDSQCCCLFQYTCECQDTSGLIGGEFARSPVIVGSRAIRQFLVSPVDSVELLVTSYIRNQQKAASSAQHRYQTGEQRLHQLAESPLHEDESPSGVIGSLWMVQILISRLKPRGIQSWLCEAASDIFHGPENTEMGGERKKVD